MLIVSLFPPKFFANIFILQSAAPASGFRNILDFSSIFCVETPYKLSSMADMPYFPFPTTGYMKGRRGHMTKLFGVPSKDQ